MCGYTMTNHVEPQVKKQLYARVVVHMEGC